MPLTPKTPLLRSSDPAHYYYTEIRAALAESDYDLATVCADRLETFGKNNELTWEWDEFPLDGIIPYECYRALRILNGRLTGGYLTRRHDDDAKQREEAAAPC